MVETVIKAKSRGSGKRAVKDIRQAGLVPGVFYMKGEENVSFAVHPLDVRDVVYTNKAKLISLEVEGKDSPLKCIIKEVTFDPITDEISHLDLIGIKDEVPVSINIPLKLVGQSPGVRAGGKLMQVLHKIKVICTLEHLVEAIEVDISGLKMGKAVTVGNVNLENYKYNVPDSTVIATVTKPRVGTVGSEDEDSK